MRSNHVVLAQVARNKGCGDGQDVLFMSKSLILGRRVTIKEIHTSDIILVASRQ